MPSGRLWGVLGLCLLSVGALGDEDEQPPIPKPFAVSISGTRVELTCPVAPSTDPIEWELNGVKVPDEQEDHLLLEKFSETKHNGYYTCYKRDSKEKRTNYLYLKARVCENCVEVDLVAVAGVIVVDVCITLGLLLLVYYWSKNRKAKAKPVTRGVGAGGRPGGQSKERPPPVPNPDYEPIRKGQRDLYSGLNQRGI
ncbi:T-cell surface glycoprotein CD3 epsilon chain [Molossus molossus]|uniref:T-cell surface glycoprotein CD3 epsilon chain n=1 Tax=Molossus molossus TaxID=27622 RepID=A0A7J8ENX0_MOLMO|nr:T-cell surface glycoprotein CD3 epsilon chain [Molossus molossus]KAF6437177.1 CD3e molecule [Molossus molossus]